MKRFMPKSLTGQMIALSLLAIVLAQVIGFAIFTDERRFALQSAAHQQVLMQTTTLIRMLEATPPSAHTDIIKAANIESYLIALSDAPKVKRDRRRPAEIVLQRHLKKMLNQNGYKIRLQMYRSHKTWVRWKPWRKQWEDYEENREWLEELEHDDDHWHDKDSYDHDDYEDDDEEDDFIFNSYSADAEKLASYKKRGFLQELTISIRLKNGQWLNIDSVVAQPSPLWALPSLIAMLLTAVILTGVVVFMMRRVSMPMRNLTKAAEAFGRGEILPPLPSVGPADVQQATDAFNKMQARLDRFVKDRTRMLAAISHDLRTPITSLRIRAEFIEDEELRAKILSTLDDMQKMTEATLSFAKQDAAKEEYQKTDLYALLDSLVTDQKDAGYQASLAGEENIVLLCQPVALKRAFANLIGNAINYGDAVLVDLYVKNHEIFVTISDNGPGVDADLLEKIFEPFYRGDDARDTTKGNVGLGLAIARSIIHAHGGYITAANKETSGLAIEVKLPQFQ